MKRKRLLGYFFQSENESNTKVDLKHIYIVGMRLAYNQLTSYLMSSTSYVDLAR